MIPLLYDVDERHFTLQSLCRLPDCARCTVTEVRNGEYSCEFVYPINGRNYDEIMLGRHIGCTHDAKGDIQPFTIYRKEANTDGTTTFYAYHLSYEMNYMVAKPFTANGAAGAMSEISLASKKAGGRHPQWYSFSTDLTSTATFTLQTPIQLRALLGGTQGSLLDAFGGEYEWDRYYVILHAARGSDDGVVIRYGGNLTGAENTDDNSAAYGSVLPFWKSQDGSNVQVYSLYSKSASDPYDTTDYYPYKAVALDLSQSYNEQPTSAQAEAAAQNYLNSRSSWVPFNSIEIDFVPWTDAEGVHDAERLQGVSLCDIVTVDVPRLGVKVATKVVKTVWNALLDRYDSMELGKARASLAEMITEGLGSSTGASTGSGTAAGISNIVLNADYTMTISLSNGTSYTVGPIRGEPGPGLPTGGTTDQMLVKASDTDYDTKWSSTLPSWMLNALYPVGSVYITMGNTNPHNFLGGTWERFGAGRTLVGVGEGWDINNVGMLFPENATGGEYKHTLTVDEMPAHSHTYNRELSTGDDTGIASARYSGKRSAMNTGSTGGGQAFNLIQPYATVYFWKRTE